MDFDSLKTQVSNLTLYDVKAGIRKVQNAVMNYTEMESKVREATNNEPWGASSSLMQEIANGTHNYQLMNEIMPMIYKRFTDKTAEEWRQIYKGLQLLEFLVKNGSERVVDEARQHIPLLKMLKQFHYIDLNGKDQGVNVRNRAQELAKLLSDVDAIRTERKKARSNRNKFRGVEGGTGSGGFNSSSQYGGFGSESNTYGGYSGEVYGDGGGFGGRETDFSDTQRRGEAFEEYDEETEGTAPARTPVSRTTTRTTATSSKRATKPKEPEQDLFDFADEPAPSSTATRPTNVLEDIGNTNTADDDFDDFQSATGPAVSSSGLGSLSPPPAAIATTTSATQFGAPKPVPPAQTQNLQNLFNTKSPSSISSSTVSSPPPLSSFQAPKPTGYQPSGPNYYTSVPTSINNPSVTTSGSAFSKPGFSSNPTTSGYGASTRAATLGKPEAKPSTASSGDAFGSLWSTASADAGLQNRSGTPKGADLASLAKERSNASFWGASGGSSTPTGGLRQGATAPTPDAATGLNRPGGAATPSLGNGLDDLLG